MKNLNPVIGLRFFVVFAKNPLKSRNNSAMIRESNIDFRLREDIGPLSIHVFRP
jgi:hypothetical protein